MRSAYFLVSCIVFQAMWFCSSAQVKNIPVYTRDSLKPNAVMFELGGNGMLYSVNYERLFKTGDTYKGIRLGYALYPLSIAFNINNAHVFLMEFNNIGRQKTNTRFNFGFGPSVLMYTEADNDRYYFPMIFLRMGVRTYHDGSMNNLGIMPGVFFFNYEDQFQPIPFLWIGYTVAGIF